MDTTTTRYQLWVTERGCDNHGTTARINAGNSLLEAMASYWSIQTGICGVVLALWDTHAREVRRVDVLKRPEER